MHDRPPAADRKRERKRARDRRQYRRELAERKIAPTEYGPVGVDYLIRMKWLDESDSGDPRAVGDAISRMLQESAEADEK